MKLNPKYKAYSYSRSRRIMSDMGRISGKKYGVNGLFELDVTEARQLMRAHKVETGESLSFTGFMSKCMAQAVEEHKMVQAVRDWRGRMIVFEDVDISIMVEIALITTRHTTGGFNWC